MTEEAKSLDEVRGKVEFLPVFEFDKEKVQNISLDMYSKSGRIEGKYGKVLDTKPIQIWQLISTILAMAETNSINAALSSIHVAQRDAHATLSDFDKERGYTQKIAPINQWTFEKTISMIDIPSVGNNGLNARLGLTLNKAGLSVAFGMNVHECANFNVMGGTVLRAYTHGENKGLPWEVMEIRLRSWMENLTQLWTIQTDWMKAMQGYTIPVNTPVIEEIFGDLYLRAIHNAYPKISLPSGVVHGTEAPFDTNELSKFAQKSLSKRQKEMNNVWDLYNWGTSIMKPSMADIGEIANNSNDWANYLVERFELDVPEYEVLN